MAQMIPFRGLSVMQNICCVLRVFLYTFKFTQTSNFIHVYIFFLQSSALIEADDIDTSNVAELEVSLLCIVYQLNKNIGIF